MAFPSNPNIGDLHNEPGGPTYIYRGSDRWDVYVNNSPGTLSNYYTKAQTDAGFQPLAANLTSWAGISPAAKADTDAVIPVAQKGIADGVATLDETGKIPTEQLPDVPIDASEVEFTPSGDLSATDVQAAIAELDAEKQPLAAYLTEWASIDPESKADASSIGTGVPSGGTTGQALVKLSGTDGDVGWATLEKIPVGAIQDFARSTAPDGWLKCNGAAVLRSSYAALDTAIYCGDILNPTALFGYRATTNISPSSNRSTSGDYIVLPDFRGEFRRGWDDGRGTDAGRAFGTAQADELKSHDHTASTSVTVSNGTNVLRTQLGGFSGVSESGGYDLFTITASATTTVNASGGTETRPRNIAVLTCIKY